MEKYKNILTGTTLIPLWAKAVEAMDDAPILQDQNAYPILQSLGYDLTLYDKEKQNPSQIGCCLRAHWIDEETLTFTSQHKPCQVIQLGAGLDDRFRRIGMPASVRQWIDLDLDEVAELRRKVIGETERNRIVSMNMFDIAWIKEMAAENLPTLIIIEGVTMFLQEEELKSLFDHITRYLGHAIILFDAVPAFAVGKARYHDSVQKYEKQIEYTWGVRNEEQLQHLIPAATSIETIRMSDLPGADKFRLLLRIMYKIPFFYRNANQWLVKINLQSQTYGHYTAPNMNQFFS